MKASCQIQPFSHFLEKLDLRPLGKLSPLVCVMLAGLFVLPLPNQAQSKRKKLKEEKAAAAKMNATIVQHLTQLHAIEPQNIPGYFEAFMQQHHFQAWQHLSFADSFAIAEGNDYHNNNTFLTLNNISLEAGTDFFPLNFSANKQVSGVAAPALNEAGAPWFKNLSDLLHEHAHDSTFDYYAYCLKESKRAAAKGATALLFYATDLHLPPMLTFRAFEYNDSLPIPIVFISPKGWQKTQTDDVSEIPIQVSVSIQPKAFHSVNYVSVINHHADSTLLLYTREPIEGLATLLSLSDVLQKQMQLNYVLIYQPYQQYHLAATGLFNRLETYHALHCHYAVEILADTNTSANRSSQGFYTQLIQLPIPNNNNGQTNKQYITATNQVLPCKQYLLTKNCLAKSLNEKTTVIQDIIQDVTTQISTYTHHETSKP